MSKKIHTYSIQDMLQLLAQDYQESGLYVDIRFTFAENPLIHPYRTTNYTLLLLMRGTIDVQVDIIPYHLKEHTLLIIPPQSVIDFKQFDSNLHFITLSFDKAFAIHQMQNEKADFTLFTSGHVNHFLLTPTQGETLALLSRLLDEKNKQKNDFPSYLDAIHHLFALILLEIRVISQENNTVLKEKTSRKEQLTFHFMELLQTHFRRERSVHFYAETLCVSERYLAKAIKEVTTQTIGSLIDHAIVVEAQLLLSNTTLSIAEIAESLHFSTISFFGTFFKRKVGCSPRAYRKQF